MSFNKKNYESFFNYLKMLPIQLLKPIQERFLKWKI